MTYLLKLNTCLSSAFVVSLGDDELIFLLKKLLDVKPDAIFIFQVEHFFLLQIHLIIECQFLILYLLPLGRLMLFGSCELPVGTASLRKLLVFPR
jgi:hypothetical protein